MIKWFRKSAGFVLLGMVLLLSACSQNKPIISKEEGDNTLVVYTSVFPMYSFTKAIAGELADVRLLLPPNAEPHDWEPTPQDLVGLENADLLIVNGAGMESWLSNIEEALGKKMPPVVVASKDIELLDSHSSKDGAVHKGPSASDPHVWLSISNAKQQMKTIVDALFAADEEHAEPYDSRYRANEQKLDDLLQQYQTASQAWTKHEIIAVHQAYGYLCRDYGLTQNTLQGLEADAEPTPARMAELSQYIQDHHVSVIFTEPRKSPKAAEALAKENGISIEELDPFENMEPEKMEANEDYFTVMAHNLDALNKALT